MTADTAAQSAGIRSPGSLLRSAREVQQLPEREVAEQLNLMPGYVDILERDDYQALRSPAFARGYVKAYGRLLGLDEARLLNTFDEYRTTLVEQQRQVASQPLQLQRTGLGVLVGLTVLALLVLALWWRGDAGDVSRVSLEDVEADHSGQVEQYNRHAFAQVQQLSVGES